MASIEQPSNGTIDSLKRPPKPPPAGLPREHSGETTGSTRAAAMGLEGMDSSARSDSSRENLRRRMHERRTSLTPQEKTFLENLMVHGNEVEVQLAHERLNDSDLFFEPDFETCWQLDTSSIDGDRSSNSIYLEGINLDSCTALNNVDQGKKPAASCSSSRASACSPFGSERRLEQLEQRKRSIHSSVWRAHESGLALSLNSSRRSVAQRQVNANRRQLAGSSLRNFDDIFRDGGNSFAVRGFAEVVKKSDANFRLAIKPKLRRLKSESTVRQRRVSWTQDELKHQLMDDVKSDNNRRSAIPQAKPQLRRLQSDVAVRRKTVSFKELPEFDEAEIAAAAADFPMSMRKLAPIRSESMSSVPSLHMAHSIRSESMSSVPSLHTAHPIRSESISSVPSLHMAHPVTSPTESAVIPDETSIPSLHRAHPIRSPSLLSVDRSEASDARSLRAAHPIGSYSFRSSIRTSSLTSFGSIEDFLEGADEKKSDEPVVATIPESVEIHKNKAALSTTAVDLSRVNEDKVGNDAEVEVLHHHSPHEASDFAQIPVNEDLPRKAILLREASENMYEGKGFETTQLEALAPPRFDEPAAPPVRSLQKPVLLRRASRSSYDGEGIEVAELEVANHSSFYSKESASCLRRLDSLLSFGETTIASVRSSISFDETMQYDRLNGIFRRSIPRSLSDENMTGIFLGGARLFLRESSSVKEVRPNLDEESNWSFEDESELDCYDAWKIIEDDAVNGYGGGGTLPFIILGTSASDVDSHPHVLSPPLMESLQAFLPYSRRGDNFWMKFSLVRDGASMHTFLQRARGARYSFLAVETVDGEVFGAFTAEPWRKSWNYFGSSETFLWRMRHSRKEKCHSILDQAHQESEIDVFPFTGENSCIQLCTHDKIAVGGGAGNDNDAYEGSPIKDHEWGFGLTIESDFLHGTSSPCLTFGSPSLSFEHSEGSLFEIINLELWTVTPCNQLEEAEKLELAGLFLENNRLH